MGYVKKQTGIDVAAPVKAVQQGIGALGNATGISPALTKVFQPIEKAVVQPAGAGLASFDKAVGKMIPGGWGTVGMVAASMIPGMQPAMMAGLGAINGSGVLHKGNSFNLQGAMMGGAMAYGMSSLAQYAQGAAGAGAEGLTPPPTVDASGALTNAPTDAISSLNASQGWTGAGASAPSAIPQSAINAANLANPAMLTSADVGALNALSAPLEAGAGTGLQVAPQPSITSNILGGNFSYAADQMGQGISEGFSNLGTKAANAWDTATTPSTYENFAKGYGENVSKTGEGIKNLVGLGDVTAKQAAAAAATSGVNPLTASAATLYGGMGLAEIEAQKNLLNSQLASDSISQQEYNNAMAEIKRSEDIAHRAVAASPFSTNPDRSASIGPTSYARAKEQENLYARNLNNLYDELAPPPTAYAYGGSVDDEPGTDDLSVGGIAGYAKGGQPRFLSGGGDGLSDDIPATIGGNQPAKLADGEFVVPSDVVSNLGNGSSKAGAKKLYDMMDRVRQQAHGSKKQISKVNANKVLPA